METTVYCHKVAHIPELEGYVKESLDWLDTLSSEEDQPRVKVWISKESTYSSRGLPDFRTKIQVTSPHRQAFVESHDERLSKSISEATHKLKNMIFNSKKGGSNERSKWRKSNYG